MATTRIAPPAIIARAGADVLDHLAMQRDIKADAEANAVGKAIAELIGRVPFWRDGQVFYFRSRSRGTSVAPHETTAEECTCEAGQQGVPCWHRQARQIILLLEWRRIAAVALAAEQSGQLPPAPQYCRHCASRMQPTTTYGGEACYECVNQGCQWTVLALLFAPLLSNPTGKLPSASV